MERRRILRLSGAAVGLPLAGCLDEYGGQTTPAGGTSPDGDSSGTGEEPESENGEDGSQNDDTDDDSSPTDDEDESESGDEDESEFDETPAVEYEMVAYSATTGEAHVEPLFSASEAMDAVDPDELSTEEDSTTETGSYSPRSRGDATEDEAVRAFIDETDFENTLLVFVRTRVSNEYYGLEVQAVDVDDDTVVILAAVTTECSPELICPAEAHSPTVLVRTTFGDEIPSDGSVTITDRGGETRRFEFDTRDAGGE